MSDIISRKKVNTRKSHICFGCAREFPKGSILEKSTVAHDGTLDTYYLCPDCQDYLYGKNYPFDEFSFGDLREGVFEMLEEKGGAEE